MATAIWCSKGVTESIGVTFNSRARSNQRLSLINLPMRSSAFCALIVSGRTKQKNRKSIFAMLIYIDG